MLKKIKNTIQTFFITLVFAGMLGAASASALPWPNQLASFKSGACSSLNQLDSTETCGKGQSSVNKVVKSIISTLSILVGIAAVIFIIVAGFKYISSGGDATKVTSAKTTLIYALVGLLVAALAQFFVRSVLSAASVVG